MQNAPSPENKKGCLEITKDGGLGMMIAGTTFVIWGEPKWLGTVIWGIGTTPFIYDFGEKIVRGVRHFVRPKD